MEIANVGPTVRRVSQGELARLLGVTTKWVREMELRGRIPAAQRDPWARRKYWMSDEVEAIIRGSTVSSASPSIAGRAPS
ncbi:MAG: hypothetical protein AB7P08_10350 [Burkholderiales bacterium]